MLTCRGRTNTFILRRKKKSEKEMWGKEMGFEVNLQNELVAGVAAVEFGACESELSLSQGGRSRVSVAHLPQCLLVVHHGVHALEHTGNTCYTTVSTWHVPSK